MSALFFSSVATAHVKWFVDTETAYVENFQPYSFTDPEVLIWICIAAIMLISAVLIDRKLPVITLPTEKYGQKILELLCICTGVSLFLSAYDGSIIAPHYAAYGGFGQSLLILQGVIGLLLIANRQVIHAGMLMFILYLGLLIQYSAGEVIEYINILGIALYFILSNLSDPIQKAKLEPYAVPILRVSTGLALVILGITEKLTGAEYGQAFIATYDWNFMAKLGFEFFTDRLLVLSAGVMEIVMGTILILGIVTRINTLVIAIFMCISNLTFVFQSNQPAALVEIIGHVPVIASAIILLFLGSGQRLTIANLFSVELRQSKPEVKVIAPLSHG